jgi:hypothetical protein
MGENAAVPPRPIPSSRRFSTATANRSRITTAVGIERVASPVTPAALRTTCGVRRSGNVERAGVSRSAAKRMTGHKAEAAYRRYAIVDEAMLRGGRRQAVCVSGQARKTSRGVVWFCSSRRSRRGANVERTRSLCDRRQLSSRVRAFEWVQASNAAALDILDVTRYESKTVRLCGSG